MSTPAPKDPAPNKPYHHGDLRNCLLNAAHQQLISGQNLTIRALAKKVGVSPTATYRHFADKRALESALAAQGYEQLTQNLLAAAPHTASRNPIADLACAYVDFALDAPEMFSLMFTTDCDPTSPERVQAVTALHSTVSELLTTHLGHPPEEDTVVAMWSLTHGLATLHVENKLPHTDRAAVHAQVRAAFAALDTLLPTAN